MSTTTILFGGALIVLGFAGYFKSGPSVWVALVPALFGAALIALGSVARKPEKRKHAMHGAAVVGVLGFLYAVRGMGTLGVYLAGGRPDHPAAAFAQVIMAGLMFAFVLLCIGSFAEARRRRSKAGQT
ncbi:MAG: hypothetical protein HY013_10755 [Candidatus Solibacter usitatus]|nr:hypothetical protein [Candidatus Solibacter usitatus]